jgi:hypothetical protein
LETEECHNSSPKTKESILDCIRWEARSRLVTNGQFKHLNHSLVFRWNLHTSVGLVWGCKNWLFWRLFFAICCLCANSVLLCFVLFQAAFAVDLVALVLLTFATCLLRLQLVFFCFSCLYFLPLRWLSLFWDCVLVCFLFGVYVECCWMKNFIHLKKKKKKPTHVIVKVHGPYSLSKGALIIKVYDL